MGEAIVQKRCEAGCAAWGVLLSKHSFAFLPLALPRVALLLLSALPSQR